MKQFKKIAALILALTMCFTLLTSTMSAGTFTDYIYYSGNGNTGGSAPSRTLFYWTTVDWEWGDWAKVSGPGSLTKTGYTFAGWNSNAAGTGTDYSENQWIKCSNSSDLYLFAKWTPIPYTVTFDAQNSTANTQVTGSIVSPVSAPSTPTKTGYTFGGWYTGTNGSGTAISFPYTPTSSITLYAKWTLNTYTVTFDAQNGTTNTQVTGSIISPVSAPSAPSKTGYTFGGWYTGTNGSGTAASFPYTPTSNITLYANWTINQYTMTFDSEGGSAVTAITQNYNTQIAKPADPALTGYTFAGWYDGDNGTGNAIAFPYTITGDVTVYAKWTINQYTMTFDSEGGSAVTAITQNYNTQIAKPTDPTRTGYTFAGWYDGDNGTGNAITFPYTITDDVTVYAKWTLNVYTVTFDAQNGTANIDVSGSIENPVNAPATAPTKTGYTFSGWYTAPNGGGTGLIANYVPTADITFYAKWTLNVYTVTFNAQNGTAETTVSGSIENPVSALSPEPTKTGYTFAGWFVAENTVSQIGADSISTAISFPYVPTSDITLYAHWTLNEYTVTFDAQNGTANTDVVGSIEAPISALSPEPTKTGYTFAGWYTGIDSTGTEITFSYVPTSDITLYANWTLNVYTVTFDAQNGTAATPVLGSIETPVTALSPEPTRTGYTFAGWYTGIGGTGTALPASYVPTADITFYANWTINSYTVIYDSAGGSSVTPVTQNYNTQVAKPADPTNYGFTFSGWYTGAYGTGTLISFPFTLTGNMTLYARWTAGEYTLTFNSEGGSSVASVSGSFGSYVSTAETPTKAGYTFGGWYTGAGGTGSLVNFPYAIAGNATFYARWIAIPVVSEPSLSSAASVSQPATTISENQTPTDVPSMGSVDLAAAAITIALFSILSIAGLAVISNKKRRDVK